MAMAMAMAIGTRRIYKPKAKPMAMAGSEMSMLDSLTMPIRIRSLLLLRMRSGIRSGMPIRIRSSLLLRNALLLIRSLLDGPNKNNA